VLRQRVLPVNNLDWNNYQIPFKFHPESDGRIFLKFFIKSAADLGGMALDNISIRLHGDLLPRWGSGNILIGNGDLPGWFWKVSDSNSIKCNGDGFTLQTASDETVTVEVKTPELMPEKEYCLRLGGNADKIMSAVAEIKFNTAADIDKDFEPLFYDKDENNLPWGKIKDMQFVNEITIASIE
jgi:hypothetical protein